MQQWLEDRSKSAAAHKPVYFSYFGCADLSHYGIRSSDGSSGNVILLPQYYETRYPIIPYNLGPGTYVISATMLKSLYSGYFVGPWRASYEQVYQQLSDSMKQLTSAMRDPAALNGLMVQTGAQIWQSAQHDQRAMDSLIRREGGVEAVKKAIQSPMLLDNLYVTEGQGVWSNLIRNHDYMRFNRLCAHLRLREPDSYITYGLLVYEVSDDELKQALGGDPPELRPANAVKGTENIKQENLDFLK